MKEDLKKQYDLRFRKIRHYRNEIWKILTKNLFQKFIATNSSVLDLGCGWGEFINNIDAMRKIAMDLNADAKEHLEPSIEFINQDCSSAWPLPDNALDVVFTSNFLEHLPDKAHLSRTVIQVKRCLKPDGKLICLGPNIKYLCGRYWDFWDHHIELTERSLAELLEMHDFSIEKCIAKFLPYTMAGNRQFPFVFVRMYLLFPVVWKLFGKQFLIIAGNAKGG